MLENRPAPISLTKQPRKSNARVRTKLAQVERKLTRTEDAWPITAATLTEGDPPNRQWTAVALDSHTYRAGQRINAEHPLTPPAGWDACRVKSLADQFV
jgi:hypothetical protein